MSTSNMQDFKLYDYEPTFVGAAVFFVLFAITSGVHSYQMFKTKTWYMLPFVSGGFTECAGYAVRAASAAEPYGKWTVMPYVAQSVDLLIAPALFAASIYMILGRIIRLTQGDRHSIIPGGWLTKIFVCSDIISFLLQSGGGTIMAKSASNPSMTETAQHIIIAGLIVQLVFFGFFVVVTAIFHRRMVMLPTLQAMHHTIRWRTYLATLYIVSAAIMARSIFRVVEYIQGRGGYLLRHEIFMYTFDALLMYLAMLYMNWQHPAEIGKLLRAKQPLQTDFNAFKIRSIKQMRGNSSCERV